MAILVWNAGNRDGRWLPDLERLAPGTSAYPYLLERSREYLDDHYVRLDFVRAAAQHSEGRTIVTEYPYGYLLAVPRLGWVDEPADGFSLSHRSSFYTSFRDFAFDSAPSGLIPADGWLAAVEHPTGAKPMRPSTLARKRGRDLPPAEPGDEIAFDTTSGQRYVVFSKRWQTAPPTSDASLRRWVVDSGWSCVGPHEPHLEDALHFRLDVLLTLGLKQRALREWDVLLASDDLPAPTRLACLGLLASRFPPQEVWNRCYRHAQAYPADPYGWVMCGAIALRGGDLPLAARMFDQTLGIDPDNMEGLAGAGIVHALSGQTAFAEECLQRALDQLHLSRRENRAKLLRWLGEVRLRQNRLEEAAEYFEEALALNSDLVESRRRLEQLRARDIVEFGR